jgi:hypothetical protein
VIFVAGLQWSASKTAVASVRADQVPVGSAFRLHLRPTSVRIKLPVYKSLVLFTVVPQWECWLSQRRGSG